MKEVQTGKKHNNLTERIKAHKAQMIGLQAHNNKTKRLSKFYQKYFYYYNRLSKYFYYNRF